MAKAWVGWRQGHDVDGKGSLVDVIWHRQGPLLGLLTICGIAIPARDGTMLLRWSLDDLFPDQKRPLGALCDGCL